MIGWNSKLSTFFLINFKMHLKMFVFNILGLFRIIAGPSAAVRTYLGWAELCGYDFFKLPKICLKHGMGGGRGP